MKELSSRAQALVDAARGSDAPDANDRARIQARLTAALGASAFTAVASQAAAMASAATSGAGAAAGGAGAAAGGVGAAASGVGAAASGGLAPTLSAAGVGATLSAGGIGAAASGGAGLAAGAVGAAGGATAIASSGAAAGVASTGWVAALGAKGVAWIGAAALSAAVGTTAVVTTSSHPEQSAREAPAAASAADTTSPAERTRAAHVHQNALQLDPTAASNAENLRQPAGASAIAATTAEPPLDNGETATAEPVPSAHPGQATRTVGRDARLRSKRAAAAPTPDRADVSSVPRRIEPSHVAVPSLLHTDVDAVSDPQNANPEQLPAGATEEAPSKSILATAEMQRSAVSSSASAAPATAVPAPALRLQPRAARPRSASAARQPGAALSGELELLARAQRALHEGKLSLALTLLDQHGAQHAQGSLREERLAARAVVLCRMHQLGAGQAEAERFASQTPRSPLLPWVRANCKR